MKEQDYQRNIVKFLEKEGAYVVKVITASKKGVPDVIACYRGRFIAIEVKTPDTMNDASPLQLYNLGTIKEAEGYSIVACEIAPINLIINTIDMEIGYVQ